MKNHNTLLSSTEKDFMDMSYIDVCEKYDTDIGVLENEIIELQDYIGDLENQVYELGQEIDEVVGEFEQGRA